MSDDNTLGKFNISPEGTYPEWQYKPRLKKWLNEEYWTIDDLLSLWVGVDPQFMELIELEDPERYTLFRKCTLNVRRKLAPVFPVNGRLLPEKVIKLVRDKGLKIPPELEKYFLNDVNENKGNKKVHGHTYNRIKRVKQIADAAIWVLEKSPDLCRNDNDRFFAETIGSAIDEKRNPHLTKKYGWSDSKKPSRTNIIKEVRSFLKGADLTHASEDDLIKLIKAAKEAL